MYIIYGYSNELLMPFAEADKRVVKKLFGNDLEEYRKDMAHLKFQLSEPINLDDYVRWTKLLKHL